MRRIAWIGVALAGAGSRRVRRRRRRWTRPPRPRAARSRSGARGPTDSCTAGATRRLLGGGTRREALPDLAPADRSRAAARSATSTDATRTAPTCGTRPTDCRSATPTRCWRRRIPRTSRDEDHFGHKVEWENDLDMEFGGAGGAIFQKTCDVLTKLHQGTHSKDAFTNNLHELIYHIECDDGTEMHVTLLAAIGEPGEFRRSCDRRRRDRGGSGRRRPTRRPAAGSGAVPDRTCIEQHMLVAAGEQSNTSAALHETLGDVEPLRPGRRPHARLLQPVLPGAPAEPVPRRARCIQRSAARSTCATRRPQPGDRRAADIARRRLSRAPSPGSPTTTPARRSMAPTASWISTPTGSRTRTGRRCGTPTRSGGTGSPTPFPNSIRQWIALGESEAGVDDGGPVIGDDRDYTGQGTRAPN